MAKLILRGADGPEREVSLDEKGSVTIGRSPECDIPIDDTQASRRHCSVVKLTSGFELADLGSTNGTLLNSTLVKRKKLQHGDVIRIGGTEIAFDDPGSARPAGERESCSLVYAKGERKGERVELTQQRTTIGRKETNTVVLADKVASSYHCEIVRDLNGYVIRDLGSTNGTLVNNEMVTEAPLTHGARIRIGNVRFVFQDPAMAEIDLELAGVEDDASEWAMMRELDLTAVRRRHPATFVYLGLFLALLGGGYYLMFVHEKGPAQGGPTAPAGNRHAPWSFESAAARFTWDAEPQGSIVIDVTESVKGEGKSSLQLEMREDVADAFYGESLPARERLRLQGKVGARGGARARLGLLWTGLGLSQWSFCPEVEGKGLTPVAVSCSAPPWAGTVRLGVHVEGRGTVHLDDVALVPDGPAQRADVEQNDFRITVTDGTSLDVAHGGFPVLARGRLFARDASGKEIPAEGLAVRAEAADPAHVAVTITGGGSAALVGIELEEVRGYLTQGGFRAFGYVSPEGGETYFVAAFPDDGRTALAHVRKVLVGNPGRAFAVLSAADDGRLESEAAAVERRALWSILGRPAGGEFAFRIKTDLRGESVLAQERITEALNLHQQGRWGEYLELARAVRAEFPFASKALLTQLGEKIQEVERQQDALEREAEEMLADYDGFKDLQSLDRVAEILADLRTRFQVQDGVGPRGERLQKIAAAEAEKRGAAMRERQGRLAAPILEQAVDVSVPSGEVYSAALLLSYIVVHLPESPQAAEARAELEKIGKEHPEVLEVFRRLRVGEGK